MNSKDNIEKLIKDLVLPSSKTIDERILNDALTAYEKTETTKTAERQPIIWRMIMNKPITKIATAAAIILIAVLGITLLDKSATPAWAIEDTITALENIYSIKISGTVSGVSENGENIKGDFVIWAKPNDDGSESKELRYEVSGQTIVVDAREKQYTYHPKQNSVSIENKQFRLNPWLGSKFFHIIKKFAQNWKISYGKDEETGRDSIFATCIYTPKSKSWWFQFDSETKMPVSFKQWENINFTGEPQFYAERIEYNPKLPEGIFEFEIPEGTKVINGPQKLPGYFDDPNVGISAEGLTDEEACLALVEDYWRAIIDGDWKYLAQLRPICTVKEWEFKYKRNENWPIEVLEISQPSQENGCNIGPVVSCMVKYSDGQVKNIILIVKIRNIDGKKSCVIAGTYGGIKDFER